MLVAEFQKTFARGPVIHGALQCPVDSFCVTVLFGPSGCGKTTILRCLAGLETPDSGSVRFGDTTWFDSAGGIDVPPQRRGVGFLFQDYALFPHMNVGRNIAYGLVGLDVSQREQRVAEMMTLLKLDGLGERMPGALSGGQQQRVALARALAPRPRVLLLDEPLSALDTPTRIHLRRELRHVLAALKMPTVLVTHERIEAIALGDRIVVMDEGRVHQSGDVREVFGRPADRTVARIVGVETVEPGRVESEHQGVLEVKVGNTTLRGMPSGEVGSDVYVCIRAEDVILERADASVGSSARNHLPGRVTNVMGEGALTRVTVDVGFALSAVVTTVACEEMGLAAGQVVTAVIKAPAITVLARE